MTASPFSEPVPQTFVSSDPQWYKRAVFYEVLVRGFKDSNDDGTGDLHGGGSATVQPVVPGWQAVPRGDRAVAFDVPKDWKLDPQSTDIGFNDAKGNPAVLMGGPAEESKYSCGGTARAAAGTKGGKNAKSLQAAAEAEAENWAYFAFTDLTKNPKPLPHLNKAVPFTNSHGIKGYAASATETGEPNTGKCASNGAAYAVAWPGADNQLTIWVMYTENANMMPTMQHHAASP